MRAIYLSVLLLFAAAALSLNQVQGHHSSQPALLLAQNVGGAQNAPVAPHPPSDNSPAKDNGSNPKQKPDASSQPADPNGRQPNPAPWLGAPPQFQRTWPPTPLPQSDDDDLLLIQPPRHPPNVHKA